ncbi:thioredoxin 1 [Desulfitobacterium sp. LBE]|uniref:Glutaredoxin-like protein n=1 Tax=Desulfitobacterium hafniense TaxID=49338 RepID=A0A098B769_DESHA|nr:MULTISPECIES: thioredoxin family protein [Desulfitobacterium]TWH58236.1 thioredoxin 1 [Desulfitobacterium sp. LBE]CDX04733.1 Glutaredoxin-like protein [Desulfitobacterium hafniense]
MSLIQLDRCGLEELIYDIGEGCLIFFYRNNCPVCEEMAPVLEELQPKYKGQFGFYYVNIDENKEVINCFKLDEIPQVLFFKDGEYQGKLSGEFNQAQVVEKIQENLVDLV